MPRAILAMTMLMLAMNAEAQATGGWWGTTTIVSTGRGGTVAPEDATWLESDVDAPPSFVGGAEALSRWFAQVHGCGADSVSAGCWKDREVLVWFIVERDGSVQEAWIDRGGCAELQERTLCAVLRMPAWTPGVHRGEAVRTRVRIPVAYEER